MKIVSFIEPTQPDVIQKILTHCGLTDEPPRAPPQDTSPALGELPHVDPVLLRALYDATAATATNTTRRQGRSPGIKRPIS